MTQKALLLDALVARGWEVVDVEAGDWWADEVVVLHCVAVGRRA